MALLVPDGEGELIDVVQGYANISDYAQGNPYQGALVGRYANRIGQARLELDGSRFELQANHGPHQLHGGPEGLHNRIWKVVHHDEGQLTLQTTLPDGCSGFPGNLDVQVNFQLSLPADLTIRYEAMTDAPTVINLTHHAYFNLNGHAGSLEGQLLQVFADHYTETDEELIATGRIRDVAGTALDLRQPVSLTEHLDAYSSSNEFAAAGGLDHNLVLRDTGTLVRKAAILRSLKTGLTMEVLTDQPGLQVYTANMENSPQPGKHGVPYYKRSAVCLECQHFPDSPNHAGFPSTVLMPGQTYRQTTIYKFKHPNGEDNAR